MNLNLIVNGDDAAFSSFEDIETHIRGLGFGDFVILSRADEHYMQTAMDKHGPVLEKRLGDADHHYQATYRDEPGEEFEQPRWWQFWKPAPPEVPIAIDDVIMSFRCFFDGSDESGVIVWKKMGF